VIGPKGAEVDKLKASLEELTNRRVAINIIEIKNPDLDAKLLRRRHRRPAQTPGQLPPHDETAGRGPACRPAPRASRYRSPGDWAGRKCPEPKR